ncbi:MAG: peptidase [Akkermansiaceae bacterium]|nr:peptidase [Akkermansiaceae bacterium]
MNKRFFAFRKVIFWAHLIAGVAVGGFILVMAVTGILLSFEPQLTDLADRSGTGILPGERKLGPEELIARLKDERPEAAPVTLALSSDPRSPAVFQYGGGLQVLVDPYTGELLGEGATGVREFFAFLNRLHRSLAMSGNLKGIGGAVTAATSLIFFLIVISGLYLWVPRRWTRKGVKVITTFQRGLKGRTRDWNWHNVLGIWFAIPLLIEAGTGVAMSYHWAGNLLVRLGGGQPEVRNEENRGGRRGPGDHGDPGVHGESGGAERMRKRRQGGHDGEGAGGAVWPESTVGLNRAFTVAGGAVAGWNWIDLELPPQRGQAVFDVLSGPRLRPAAKRTVTVELENARVTRNEGPDIQPIGRRMHALLEEIHTGTIAGWSGQALAAVAAMAAIVLIWTGFALTWRRFRKKPALLKTPT